jgi:hypothetical protein
MEDETQDSIEDGTLDPCVLSAEFTRQFCRLKVSFLGQNFASPRVQKSAKSKLRDSEHT